MLKKYIQSLLIGALALVSVVGCSKKEGPHTITVGAMAGPEAALVDVAKQVALKRYGLHVVVKTFTDYSMPNEALDDGSLDVNAFQHLPFLQAQVRDHGYKLVPVGKTFLFPIAIYPAHKSLKQLSELPKGAKVGIPNDPSNEGRALLLFEKAGLIKLNPDAGVNATPQDITQNPKQLQFVELDAANLPRVLKAGDVAVAAITNTFAQPSGLSPSRDGIFVEGTDSPYVNLIVARPDNKDELKVKQFVQAYQSQPVIDKAKQEFGEGAIPGWTQQKTS